MRGILRLNGGNYETQCRNEVAPTPPWRRWKPWRRRALSCGLEQIGVGLRLKTGLQRFQRVGTIVSAEGNKSVASVLAPDDDISLDSALLFWAAFYGRICCDQEKMTMRVICDAVVRSQYVCGYEKSFSLYSHDTKHSRIKHHKLVPVGKLTYDAPVEWKL